MDHKLEQLALRAGEAFLAANRATALTEREEYRRQAIQYADLLWQLRSSQDAVCEAPKKEHHPDLLLQAIKIGTHDAAFSTRQGDDEHDI